MRLACFRSPDDPRHAVLGRVEDGGTVWLLPDLPPIGPQLTIDQLVGARPARQARWDSLDLLPVSPTPSRVIGVGLNYRSHITETRREQPVYPVLFTKFASALIAGGQPIMLPPESWQVDYEAELAVVIGRPGRRIAEPDALGYVLGYTIANDVTMRDYQNKTHQWLPGKSWDSSTPLGPVLVTADELQPGQLDITLRLNGRVLQHANTARLIFSVAQLIATVSQFTALSPGDVILTGTPGGVGYRRDPQVFITDGDMVEAEIQGIGTLRNPAHHEPAI